VGSRIALQPLLYTAVARVASPLPGALFAARGNPITHEHVEPDLPGLRIARVSGRVDGQ
jgi:hypothetical protein